MSRAASGVLRDIKKPAGMFIPRSASKGDLGNSDLKRSASSLALTRKNSQNFGQTPMAGVKKARADVSRMAVDAEGRPFNWKTVIVNFANVGSTYGIKVLGRDKNKGEKMFDWEGVRRCLTHLTQEMDVDCIGVIMEKFFAPDNGVPKSVIPEDIRQMCVSIEETPDVRAAGKHHKSCDDEMTIKCAYRRNCRFLDNDNYRDWVREMRDDGIRRWLEGQQEALQMRYFFDTMYGDFDTLDGSKNLGAAGDMDTPAG